MKFKLENIKKPIEEAVKAGILVAATSLPVFAQNQKPIEKDTLPSKEIKVDQTNTEKDSTYIMKGDPINNPNYKKPSDYLENPGYLDNPKYKENTDYLNNTPEINKEKLNNIELDFTNKTQIEFSREILNKIDFIKLTFDANSFVQIEPDTTGNYIIYIPSFEKVDIETDQAIILRNVSPECLNNFIGKIEGENVNETAAPGGKIENATPRPTIEYNMPIEDFIIDAEMLEDLRKHKKEEGDSMPKKVRVKQYHENWDTFLKKWEESKK